MITAIKILIERFFPCFQVSHTLKNLVKLLKINNGPELHARQGMNKMDDKYEIYYVQDYQYDLYNKCASTINSNGDVVIFLKL